MKHLTYLRYVIRHKWFVFVECIKLGVPLYRAIIHDWDKFLPDEWFPYVEFFHGDHAPVRRNKTGYYKPVDTGNDAFDFAWFLHQKRNDHHWQWWVLPTEGSGTKALPMSDVARKEMLADWKGAGKAQGTPDTSAWYKHNQNKLFLHDDTRKWVEQQLGIKTTWVD